MRGGGTKAKHHRGAGGCWMEKQGEEGKDGGWRMEEESVTESNVREELCH